MAKTQFLSGGGGASEARRRGAPSGGGRDGRRGDNCRRASAVPYVLLYIQRCLPCVVVQCGTMLLFLEPPWGGWGGADLTGAVP